MKNSGKKKINVKLECPGYSFEIQFCAKSNQGHVNVMLDPVKMNFKLDELVNRLQNKIFEIKDPIKIRKYGIERVELGLEKGQIVSCREDRFKIDSNYKTIESFKCNLFSYESFSTKVLFKKEDTKKFVELPLNVNIKKAKLEINPAGSISFGEFSEPKQMNFTVKNAGKEILTFKIKRNKTKGNVDPKIILSDKKLSKEPKDSVSTGEYELNENKSQEFYVLVNPEKCKGDFWLEIVIETNSNPILGFDGKRKTNSRTLMVFGTCSSQPSSREHSHFQHISKENYFDEIYLEKFWSIEIKNLKDEFLARIWPVLVARSISEKSKLSSDALDSNKELLTFIQELRLQFDAEENNAPLKEIFEFAKSLVPNAIFDCFTKVYQLLENNVSLANISLVLLNLVPSEKFIIYNGLTKFAQRLDMLFSGNNSFTMSPGSLVDLFDELLKTDNKIFFYFKPKMELINAAITGQDFIQALSSYIKNESLISSEYSKILELINKKDKSVYGLIGLMKNSIRTLHESICHEDSAEATKALVGFLENKIPKDTLTNFIEFTSELKHKRCFNAKLFEKVYSTFLDCKYFEKLIDFTNSVYNLYDKLKSVLEHIIPELYGKNYSDLMDSIQRKRIKDKFSKSRLPKNCAFKILFDQNDSVEFVECLICVLEHFYLLEFSSENFKKLRSLLEIVKLIRSNDYIEALAEYLKFCMKTDLIKTKEITPGMMKHAHQMKKFASDDSLELSLKLVLNLAVVYPSTDPKEIQYLSFLVHRASKMYKKIRQGSDIESAAFEFVLGSLLDETQITQINELIHNTEKIEILRSLEIVTVFGEAHILRNELNLSQLAGLSLKLIEINSRINKSKGQDKQFDFICELIDTISELFSYEFKSHRTLFNAFFTLLQSLIALLKCPQSSQLRYTAVIVFFARFISFVTNLNRIENLVRSISIDESVEQSLSVDISRADIDDFVSSDLSDDETEVPDQHPEDETTKDELDSEEFKRLETECQEAIKALSDAFRSLKIDLKVESLSIWKQENVMKIVDILPGLQRCSEDFIKLLNLTSKYAKTVSSMIKKDESIFEDTARLGIEILRSMVCAQIWLGIYSDKSVMLQEFVLDLNNLKKIIELLQTHPQIHEILKRLEIFDLLNQKDLAEMEQVVRIKSAIQITNPESNQITFLTENLNDKGWFDNLGEILINDNNQESEILKTTNNVGASNLNDLNQRKPTNNVKNSSQIHKNNFIQPMEQAYNYDYQCNPQDNQEPLVSKEIKIAVDQGLLKGLQSKEDISLLYDKAAVSKKSEISSLKIIEPTDENIDKNVEWAYKQLVESSALAGYINGNVKIMREEHEKLLANCNEVQHFEWCVMVDNSGSMVNKKNYVAEALVVVIEILRRLEHKFAIARFGSKYDKHCLLKSLNQAMSMSLGQRILERLTYDQGTYALDGLSNVVKHIWGERVKAENQHRIVLIITDGLTTQKNTQEWTQLLKEKGLKLGITIIKEPKHSYPRQFLEHVTTDGKCFNVINSNESDKLPVESVEVVRKLMAYVNKNLSAKSNTNDVSDKKIVLKIPELKTSESVDFNLLEKVTQKITFEQAKEDGNYKPELMYIAGRASSLAKNPAGQNLRESDIDEKRAALESYYCKLESQGLDESILSRLDKLWNECESKLGQQVDDYVDAVQSSLLPCNKFTRRRADLKGSNLHLPGLIKAVISDFNYRKIFSTKTAGGKRDYALMFALDISNSMSGHLTESMLNAFITLLFSLNKIGIENYSIILFAETVKLIKLESQPWNSLVLYTLIQALKYDREYMTNDADAIITSLNILQASNASCKKILVFTDGYTSCNKNLQRALDQASSLNIETIAITVGFDKSFVHSTYNSYIHVALPSAFHEALRFLYDSEASEGLEIKEREKEAHEAGNYEVIKILETIKANFNDEMVVEREAKLIQHGSCNDFNVDICFCIDTTGSMSPWFNEAKTQIVSVVDLIKQAISEKYPSVNLVFNFGAVAFKDISDGAAQFKDLHFSPENATELKNFLNSLSCSGGGDIAEDLLGPLNRITTSPNWNNSWKSKAKFVIMLTDSPNHGSEFTNGINVTDNYPGSHPNGLTVQSVMKNLKEKNIEFLFVSVIEGQTGNTGSIFRRNYDDIENGKQMSEVALYNKSNVSFTKKHFIFLLDESGSMHGNPWQELMQAYASFIDSKKDEQSSINYISVITHDDLSRIRLNPELIGPNTAKYFDMRGGGNTFTLAFQTSENLVRMVNDAEPIIIFMSDGCAEDPSVFVQSMMTRYSANKLKIHSIAFGQHADLFILNKIAQVGGTGAAKKTINGAELFSAFMNIARDERVVMDQMVGKFAEYIGKEIGTKIILEYL